MLKLGSNGVHLQTPFSLHLNRLLLYSTSSLETSFCTSMVDYMVKKLGFSKEEAFTALNKVSPSKLKSSKKPVLVVEYLKKHGFDNTQIKKTLSSMPNLLWYSVDKTLEPKFNALQKLGIQGSDLAIVVASNSSILRRGLTTKVVPMINFVKSVLGSDKDLLKVLRRSYWLMSSDIATMLQPNMELFKSYGLSDEKIRQLLVYHAEVFGHDPKRLENILLRVEEELGIPRMSCMFINGIVLLASLSKETLESKYQMFRSFGWTDLDIMTMVRKLPRCMMLSETIIYSRLNIFINELGCEPAYIVPRPYMLAYSMETRVLPRNTILKVLKERKLIKTNPSVLSAVCMSEPLFLKQFVLPYKDELPDLCEAYIYRKKNLPFQGGCLVDD